MPLKAPRIAVFAASMSAICDQMSAATISFNIENRRIAISPCGLGAVCCPSILGAIVVAASPARKMDRRERVLREEARLYSPRRVDRQRPATIPLKTVSGSAQYNLISRRVAACSARRATVYN